ncbi:hypothetical protein M885DRAFT_615208 [Pelagophyceae sp. CCMP2097]|nr:hypothetical protein M885DRAFT_615208 [Pelagophyceae sp. CCMP2097]
MSGPTPTWSVDFRCKGMDFGRSSRRCAAAKQGQSIKVEDATGQDQLAMLRGGTHENLDGVRFEETADVLVFEPPLAIVAAASKKGAYTIACEVQFRKSSASKNDARWLVVTYGNPPDDQCAEPAHVCVKVENGKRLLGCWDGMQWMPCEPPCEMPGGSWHEVVAVGRATPGTSNRQGTTVFFVDGKRVGMAATFINSPIVGAGNVPPRTRNGVPDPLAIKQVVGRLRRLQVFRGVALDDASQCLHDVEPEATCLSPTQPPRRVKSEGGVPSRHVKEEEFCAAAPPPKRVRKVTPVTHDDAVAVVRSRALRSLGEEDAFLEALVAARRGLGLWAPYIAVDSTALLASLASDADTAHGAAALRELFLTRPDEIVFKFEEPAFFDLGPLGAELTRCARDRGGSHSMRELRKRSQVSQVGVSGCSTAHRSWANLEGRLETAVDFGEFIAGAAQSEEATTVADLDAALKRGSMMSKITQWKPDFLRNSQLVAPPMWFVQSNWLSHLAERQKRNVFLPKFALMQAGALTTHHRDNYGAWTWIRMIGGEQLLAVWSMADGDAAPRMGDAGAPPPLPPPRKGRGKRPEAPAAPEVDGEDPFTWAAFVALPSARLVLLRPGDFFLMRPGTYHRVVTLRSKVQLFGEYVLGPTFQESLRSVDADMRRGACLDACDTTITMTDVLHGGLRYELERHCATDHVALRAFHVLTDSSKKHAAALDAVRWLDADTLAHLSRLLGFELDAVIQFCLCRRL